MSASKVKPPPPFPQLPVTIHNYILTELIGSGGSGTVYKAVHTIFPQEFAIKVLALCKKQSSFDAEVSSLSILDHPNVIRVYDSFKEGDLLFLVLEYCPLGTLDSYVVENEGLPDDMLIPICKQIIEGIAYCHAHGVSHNDIKPSNILISSSGNAKIADFGFALKHENGEMSYNFMGTYSYTSPEIIRRESHCPFKSDVFSLGVTLYYLATGSSIWAKDSIEILIQSILECAVPLIRTRSNELDRIIRRMIIADPNKRITMKGALSMDLFTCEYPKKLSPPIFKKGLLSLRRSSSTSDDASANPYRFGKRRSSFSGSKPMNTSQTKTQIKAPLIIPHALRTAQVPSRASVC